MFYPEDIEHYNVCINDSPTSVYNISVGRLELSPPRRMKKVKGTIFLLNNVVG